MNDSRNVLRVLSFARDSGLLARALAELSAAHVLEHVRVERAEALVVALDETAWDLVLGICAAGDADPREFAAALRRAQEDSLAIVLQDEDDEAAARLLLEAGVRAVLGPSRVGRLAPIVAREIDGVRRRRQRDIHVVLESSPDPMLVVDAAGNIRDANLRLAELLGYAAADLVGRPVETLVPEGARSGHGAKREKFTAAPHHRPMGAGVELAARHSSGELIPVEISLSPAHLGGERLVCCGLRDLRKERRADRLLRAIMEASAGETGEPFMRVLVRNLAQALDVRYAFVSDFGAAESVDAGVLAFWDGQGFAAPFRYPLAGTPCAAVRREYEFVAPAGIRAQFPDDPRLKAFGVESFFGTALRAKDGTLLGALVVADAKPLADVPLARTVMRVFAARAGAELERMRTTAALAESEARLRSFLELGADFLWEQDQHLRFTARIGKPVESLSYPLDSVIGRTRWELPANNITPLEWDRHRAALEAREEFRNFEIERPLPAGGSFWIGSSGRPVFDAEGRFRGYRGIGVDITERKRAERALAQSEAKFRDLTELTADWYWEFDTQYRFIDLRSQSVEKAGIRPPGLHGSCAWDHAGTSLSGEQWAAFRATLDARESFRDFEYSRPSADGRRRWVSISGLPVFDADGAFAGYRGIGRDITPRKEAEQALHASEERFRATFEQAAVGIAHVALDGRFLRVNRKFCGIVGYQQEELLDLSFQDITHASDREPNFAQLRRLSAGETDSFSMEKRYRHKDGSIVWVNLTVALVWTPAGAPDYYVSVIEDISRRHAAEVAVQERDAELRLLMDHVPAMIAYSDAAYRYRYANRQFADFYAPDGTEVAGKALHEVIGTAALEEVRSGIARALGGETVSYETVRRRRDGRARAIEVALVPHRDRNGNVAGVFTFILDVTDRHDAEKAARERAALEAANEELNAFAYTVAHDLRAPLRAIAGFAEMLRESDGEQLSPDGLRSLARVEAGARRLHELIESLLTYARSAQSALQMKPLDIGTIARQVVDELGPLYASAQVAIGGLPAARGDPTLIGEVLANLIGNAFKYSAKREAPLVRIGFEQTSRGNAYFVRDNGAGFDARYAGKLFGVFQRLHSEADFPGSGVGLAFARRVLARHGGEIWAESAPGEGATFWFTLPAAN